MAKPAGTGPGKDRSGGLPSEHPLRCQFRWQLLETGRFVQCERGVDHRDGEHRFTKSGGRVATCTQQTATGLTVFTSTVWKEPPRPSS